MGERGCGAVYRGGAQEVVLAVAIPTICAAVQTSVSTLKAQRKGARMNTKGTYLAVFLSNKTSPRWRAWYAMSDDERRAKDEEGLAALKAWDEKHQEFIVYDGGPLGPTKRTSQDGVSDVVNELTVFVVVRAPSHEAAAKMFEGHPHFTIFPCDAVDVMPLLGPKPGA
jgi:hypothetical protein